ncbi:hypothetical protein NLU13_8787 [Sarocladium strictum]|uniref:Peptidase A1 domain-containing protein n=1 Tax=Sarocladium strictum TaxID=5046 RepID=A0AA39G9E2_SARSR|nr:hypothetical protein NLU13_8787 [Sarocladium strictum]
MRLVWPVAAAYIIQVWFVLADDEAAEPLVIPASEHFEGNDGPWSTFDIRVGKPEQHVRVLISTSSPQPMVVLSELGCSEDVFDSVPSGCARSRGSLFNVNNSSTWTEVGTYEINEDGLGFQGNLGYSQRAQWGIDEVGIGLTGPRLENQTVAGIATAEPFYLGLFGLNNQPVNFSDLGNTTNPSFLTTLKDENIIPSLSWSYTAGAKYRLKQVYGQLIFSGYDKSRFTENSVSFTMADDITRDLVVGLQSISYSGSTTTTLLSNAIDIFIDSTDPNMWLPKEVCDAFEDAFNIHLDDDTGLYLINDTHRNSLLDTDAEVTFRLSDDKSGGETVSIALPYAAFDLRAEVPLVENGSYYFPLKRADNESQYTLGRVFLQEAYLSADYERKTFNVSACTWNSGAESDIVMIKPIGSGSDSQSESGQSGSGLSGGEVAGIVVGAVVGTVVILALGACLFLRHRRRSKERAYNVTNISPRPSVTMVGGPAHVSGVPYSSADVSGWSPSTNSPPRPLDLQASVTTGSTPELDGQQTQVIPGTEIDGKAIYAGEDSRPQKPGVYELAGSRVDEAWMKGGDRRDGTPNSGLSSDLSNDVESGGPRSPTVSTTGTAWGEELRPVSELVSPVNPRVRSK